jgi:hypothetical protein
MKLQKFRSVLRSQIRNIPGWTTGRKIVVFESDDWGSIRMWNKETRERLLKYGIDNNPFILNDALESNSDLELLFEVLSGHKDKNGNNPTFTGLCLIANPDFDKIKNDHFQAYHYEPFTTTCSKYPFHDKVPELWQTGIRSKLFIPQFHGREHLNVSRWMRALQTGNKALLTAFENNVFGISGTVAGQEIPDHLAAFDIESYEDINALEFIINDGTKLFSDITGYTARYFVPPNSPGPSELENVLNRSGIDLLNYGRIFREPRGNGIYKKRFITPGSLNKYGQIFLARNCFFEPSVSQMGKNDFTDFCLSEIKAAFSLHKPAVISTHRVNYAGTIDSENRSNGLKALDAFLKKILDKWPDIEFLTSVELGDLIRKQKI